MTNKNYKNNYPFNGRVEWLGIRPVKKMDISVVDKIELNVAEGIVGDHYQGRSGDRQVTLIQSEHLDTLASFMQGEKINPALTRRNIVISGINLNSLNGKRMQLGDAELIITKPCLPCKRMEENIGSGALNAIKGMGGWCAKVVKNGIINLGDQLIPLSEE